MVYSYEGGLDDDTVGELDETEENNDEIKE